MAELKMLEYKYSKNYRTAFEDLATLMFCTRLGLSRGVNRRINEKGIESEPVKIGTKKCAYQVKYYEESTKLYEHKDDLIESIEVASAEGVTDLYFFINKNIPPKVYRTNKEPLYIRDIKKAAADNNLSLHWWTLSKIESTLDMPEYQYIRDIYLGRGETNLEGFSAFYEYIHKQFIKDSESELYGGISLSDSYIEPTVEIIEEGQKKLKRVRNYLEEWVQGEDPITIICGEPGHGKTSLCHKAMCDFYKEGWLVGKVTNVFCFSLNPANTNALSNNSLYLYALLSWGNDRKKHMITEEDCKNALVFFDGFDELIEWYPKLNISDFIKKYIIPFHQNTGSLIVITSRTMALEPDKTDYTFRNGMKVLVNKLQPINRQDQLSWIYNYIQRVQEISLEEAKDIENYYEEFRQMLDGQYREDNSIDNILGIPIIFRMIVTARYHPAKGQSITEIYNELFEITWERHNRQDDNNPLVVKEKLAWHALKIFIDDNDTAETDTLNTSSWLFSFYTTHEGKKRVGFLHRSFYHYFLAYEILSWYKIYACNHKINELRDRLAYLARKKLDKTTMAFITELYLQVEDKEALDESFEKVFYILKETDGILLLPEDRSDAEKVQKVIPLERASNVFWNSVSIGSICDKTLFLSKINNLSLRTYDLSECKLKNAQLEGVDLNRSVLARTELDNATLIKANLNDAILNAAQLSGVDLSNAELCRADLRYANLSGANLEGANLSGALLESVNLSGANLSGANLSGATINHANLSGANLNGANLSRVYLSNITLKGAVLRRMDFSEAEISEVLLVYADLSESDFRGTNFNKVDFRQAKLKEANLTGGVFYSSYLNKVDFNCAILVGTSFIDTNISGAEFCDADLSSSSFSGSNLVKAKLIGAKFNRAYFREVNLGGANLKEADLRKADFRETYLTGVNLTRAKLKETDFNDTKFNEVNMDSQNAEYLKMSGYDTSVVNIVEHVSEDSI